MARRYSRRAKSFEWTKPFEIPAAIPSWPTVLPAIIQRYVPFKDRCPTLGPVAPEAVDRILHLAQDNPLLNLDKTSEAWKGTPPRLSGPWPPNPSPPTLKANPEDQPEPVWEEFKPKKPWPIRALVGLLGGAPFVGIRDAEEDFERAVDRWREDQTILAANREALAEYDKNLRDHARGRETIETQLFNESDRYDRAREDFGRAGIADLNWLKSVVAEARAGVVSAVESVAQLCWSATPLPLGFDRTLAAAFDLDQRTLLVEITAPNFDYLPLRVQTKTTSKAASAREQRRCQQLVLYALPLRLLHELFSCPALAGVERIGVNVSMEHTDPTDGHRRSSLVATVASSRETVQSLNVRDVDPKACFRKLKGLSVPSLDSIVAIPPVLRMDRSDRRIVAAEAVLSDLEAGVNLAAMDWEEFEHLVRELFEKMFLARSPDAEVRVTRASRDWGVDAIVFDPDPIHGGKFVIQAKRYTRLVEVAAVRDLYGTLLNEGANRGFLVTTSTFGPDAYEFATSKPLTLIDGPGLLALFEKFGYHFSIDLAAARAARS